MLTWMVRHPFFISAHVADFFIMGVQMRISDNGINILKQCEGCVKNGNRHVIYDDKTGRPINTNGDLPHGATIGYGHLIKYGEDFSDGITEHVATELLKQDISIAETAVNNNINVPLSQNQYDALVILTDEHPERISFRMDWLDFLATQGTLKSLLKHQFESINSLTLSLLYGQPSHP